jgi:hypothetical protein
VIFDGLIILGLERQRLWGDLVISFALLCDKHGK